MARELEFGSGPCAYRCGNQHTGIAVRMRKLEYVGIDLHEVFDDVFICDACWNMDNPDKVPVRVHWGGIVRER